MATSVTYTSKEGTKFNDITVGASTISDAAVFAIDPAKLNTKKKILDVLEQLKVKIASSDFPA